MVASVLGLLPLTANILNKARCMARRGKAVCMLHVFRLCNCVLVQKMTSYLVLIGTCNTENQLNMYLQVLASTKGRWSFDY